jgi:hypothetical protein
MQLPFLEQKFKGFRQSSFSGHWTMDVMTLGLTSTAEYLY